MGRTLLKDIAFPLIPTFSPEEKESTFPASMSVWPLSGRRQNLWVRFWAWVAGGDGGGIVQSAANLLIEVGLPGVGCKDVEQIDACADEEGEGTKTKAVEAGDQKQDGKADENCMTQATKFRSDVIP